MRTGIADSSPGKSVFMCGTSRTGASVQCCGKTLGRRNLKEILNEARNSSKTPRVRGRSIRAQWPGRPRQTNDWSQRAQFRPDRGVAWINRNSETKLSARQDFDWERWVRVSAAQHYLQVDEAWFAQNIRRFPPVLQIPNQANASRREDLDARAARIECEPLGLYRTGIVRDCVNDDAQSYVSVEFKRLRFARIGRAEDAVVGVPLSSDHCDVLSLDGSYFIQRLNANAAGRDFHARTGRF